jgi:bidirectional [NiFe] hydrogenase diaphorase subunit
MGITLREIVEEMGGGVPDGQVKAVQTGVSGGCIPANLLDTPVDYESLAKLGSMMGFGGMVVMDDSTSMVKVAKFYMEFCREESCGKCIPCRTGTVQMFELLAEIIDWKGRYSRPRKPRTSLSNGQRNQSLWSWSKRPQSDFKYPTVF